ncbi:MAG TPA: hypothetical protein VK252_01770 [Solirubrobacteraceae bacterium]|nr:hypothetical protein [Solirubrobacteraceae bacterium]
MPRSAGVRGHVGAAAIGVLQRSAGNAATARLLTRRALLARVEIAGTEYEQHEGLEDPWAQGDGTVWADLTESERTVATELVRSSRSYRGWEDWTFDVRLRAALIDGINRLNELMRGGVYDYNRASSGLKLPGSWQERDRAGEAAGLPPKADPAKEVAAIFFQEGVEPPEDAEFYLDCHSALLASHYRALSEVLGASEFNRRFGNAGITIHHAGAPKGTELDLTEEIKIKSLSLNGLLPGDLVYFSNYLDYSKLHTGSAAVLSGEHAVVLPGKRFAGFGAEGTHDEIVKMLQRAYNEDISSAKKKTQREDYPGSLDGKLPGIVSVRRALKPGAKK